MKKIMIMLAIAVLPIWLIAQDTPLTELYKEFATKSGYSSTEIKPNAMSFEWEKTTEFPMLREMMKNIESVRILQYKPESAFQSKDKLWKKVLKAAEDEQYIELASANTEDFQMRMYILKGENNIVKEASFCVKKEDGVILGTITGNLDFSTLFSAENMQAMRDMGKFFMEQKGQCHHDNK